MAAGKEVDALAGGFRARALLLSVLVLGGIGAAVWDHTREHGIEEAEQRHRVRVVTAEPGIDYYAVLERGGFEVEFDSYESWLDKAHAAREDSELEGVALLLEHADAEGIGYLIFESPGTRDFSGLELEPAPTDIEDFGEGGYAALSVGDLAFPHVLSVDDPAAAELVRLPGYGALAAVFGQPSLLARADDERPTVPELQHEHRIERGQQMAERPASFAAALDNAGQEIAASFETGPARAPAVVPPWTTGSAIFDPSGGLLVVSHALEIYSEDATRLDLHPAPRMRFDYLGAKQIDALLAGGELDVASGLAPCESLMGGGVDMAEAPRLEAAVDGSALAVSTKTGTTALWHRQALEGCAWQQVAELDGRMDSSMVIAPARTQPGSEPGSQLLMAQVGAGTQGLATLRVWSGAGLESAEVSATETRRAVEAVDIGDARGAEPSVAGEGELEVSDLLWLPDARLSSLAFVGEHHLALLSSTPLPAAEQTTTHREDHVLHLVDRRAPGSHLRVPTDFFAPGWSLLELALAAAPTDERGPAFVLTATRGLGETKLLWLEVSGSVWAEFVASAPAEFEELGPLDPGGVMRLHALTPEDLQVRELEGKKGEARLGLSVALGSEARGPLVAYTTAEGPSPSELALLELDSQTWAPRRLTEDRLVDTLPRLSADGTRVVFMSMVRSAIDSTPYSVPRVMAVAPAGS